MLIQTEIGFDVSLSSTMSSGSKIAFDTIKTNIGGGWSNRTHTFTAPVDGLYYFTLGVMTRASFTAQARARMMRGNVPLRYVVTGKDSTSGHQPATGSVVIRLARGQEVHAERTGGGPLFSSPELNTHFVGFLIRKVK